MVHFDANEAKFSTAEIQFQLPEYDLIEGLFADYEVGTAQL